MTKHTDRKKGARYAIYEFLRDRGAVPTLKQPWDFLDPDKDTRITKFRPSLVADLRQRFEPDALQAAGLFSSDNRLQSQLEDSTQVLYFLRGETGRIVDVATQQGTLCGRVPLFAVSAARPESNQRIFVPFAPTDMIILRALGLAAAPSSGLDRLSRKGLQRLLFLAGGSTHGCIPRSPVLPPGKVQISKSNYLGNVEDEPPQLELVFCAFSLTALKRDLPSQLNSIARHLADANKYLGVDLEQVWVWHPTVEELENLTYRVRLRDAQLVADYLSDDHSFYEVEAFSRSGPLPPPCHPMVQTMEQYQHAAAQHQQLGSMGSQERLRDAEKLHDQQIVQCLFQPLLEAALATPDAQRRSRLVLFAFIVHLALRLTSRLDVEMECLCAANSASLLPMESIEQLESITKLVCQLLKTLESLDDES